MSSLFVMSHHSEVLQKAQQELDRVVGPHRLPDFNDRKDLPYVEAFLKEVERMYPVTPLGKQNPHSTRIFLIIAYSNSSSCYHR